MVGGTFAQRGPLTGSPLRDGNRPASPLAARSPRAGQAGRRASRVSAQPIAAPAQQIRDALSHPAIQAAADGSEQLKIMYEGLEAVYGRVAEATRLQVTPTTVSADGLHTYATEAGDTTIRFLVNRGERADWVVTSASSLAKVGGGLARLTGYSPAASQVPHLHYELGLTFGQVTLYLNLAARVNLLLDDAHFKRFYQTPTAAGPSLSELELQLQQDAAFTPFRSKSADIRLLAGPTSLLYSAPGTVENMRTAAELGRQVADTWLEFLAAPYSAAPEAKRQEIAAHDAVHYSFQRKDPGNAIIVGLLGAETTEEILKLSCRDPAILV